MGYNFLPCDRDQLYLLPPALQDWLPESDLAWFLLDAVAQIDLKKITLTYSERWLGPSGVRSYHDGGATFVWLLCGRTIESAHRAVVRAGYCLSNHGGQSAA